MGSIRKGMKVIALVGHDKFEYEVTFINSHQIFVRPANRPVTPSRKLTFTNGVWRDKDGTKYEVQK